MVFFFMDWKAVDGCLIRCGELLLSLDFSDGYDDELEAMNRKKVSISYRLTNRYVKFLAVAKPKKNSRIDASSEARGRTVRFL